ncbi:Uncharacterized protein APZ42_005166, partial [Daphnia magna]
LIVSERKPKPTKVRAKQILSILEKDNLNILESLHRSPGHVPFIPDALSCAHITGYAIH